MVDEFLVLDLLESDGSDVLIWRTSGLGEMTCEVDAAGVRPWSDIETQLWCMDNGFRTMAVPRELVAHRCTSVVFAGTVAAMGAKNLIAEADAHIDLMKQGKKDIEPILVMRMRPDQHKRFMPFWGHDSSGYFSELENAGAYAIEEAVNICSEEASRSKTERKKPMKRSAPPTKNNVAIPKSLAESMAVKVVWNRNEIIRELRDQSVMYRVAMGLVSGGKAS